MSTAGVDDPGFNRGERRRLFRFPDEHGDEDCKADDCKDGAGPGTDRGGYSTGYLKDVEDERCAFDDSCQAHLYNVHNVEQPGDCIEVGPG